ncbi:MAG TPA: type II toxin-antitoxin system VapC family toxin [Thermoanaerobaculia bacterium]|nr:type II toxin-antitoxin system VapC family toxin [Thermoanaerobaculia bacterium]
MILLDTHTWVWWFAQPNQLSAAAVEAIGDADEVGVSPISCWEVAMLSRKGRLKLDRDTLVWVQDALSETTFTVLPITPPVATLAGTLGSEFHGDPADRLIVATACMLGATIVTKDRRIRSYPMVNTLW